MPSLQAISNALLPKLKGMLVQLGDKKAESYGDDNYRIVDVSPNSEPPGISHYARTKGGLKVVDLYLAPWNHDPDAFEAAIKLTHGMDVENVTWGMENEKIGNTWFVGGILEVLIETLRDLKVRELVGRPSGGNPKRTSDLTSFYKWMGFVDTGEKSKGLAVLMLHLNNQGSIRHAMAVAHDWLSRSDAW